MSERKYLDSNGLVRLVANMLDKFSPKIHNHVISEISDYVVDSELSLDSVNPIENKVIKAEIDSINTHMQNAVLKIEQELTQDEINQVRINLHNVGQHAAGLTYYPYTPEETEDDLVFNRTEIQDGIVAAEGAEIFNDYENNLATGYYSIASGFGTQATGDFSNASGWLTRAGGYCSISSGRRTDAQGSYAHSEGIDTLASKNAAHAEGEGCQATAHRSHAEGYYTQATTNQAHAEGMYTVASGVNSHAEGWSTTAKGQNSFAGGKYTQANAANSFANGLYTVAAGQNQVVHGAYNVSDTISLMIIGNGISDTERSNAYALDSDGNGWFAGDVVSDGNGQSVSLNNVNSLLGAGTLFTEAQTIIDAINELYAMISTFVEITASEVNDMAF